MNHRTLSLWITISLGCLHAAHAAENAAGYLFTSFRDNGDGLHLAYSHDAHDWTELKRVFLNPSVGSKLMRDPHIMRGPDGLYHMVWTSGWKDKGIGYANSKDLITWSEQKYIPLMEKVVGTETTWAPELYFDEETKSYIIMWSSSVPMMGKKGAQHRAWYSLTKYFAKFTEPKILFDPPTSTTSTRR